MSAQPVRSDEAFAADRLCSRILVGVDSSPESVEAARQAVLLGDADTRLELLAAFQVVYPITVPSPVFTPPEPASFRTVAAKALHDAAAAIPGRPDAVGSIVEGRSTEALLAHAERMGATLIAVGGGRHGRLRGIVLGSTATELVHKAPCSVLIARGRPQAIRRIVVGVDGSRHSAAAYAVAAGLAERLGADLRRVVAWGGHSIDPLLVDSVLTEREDSPEDPVPALLAAAGTADLLVVGSRGLHGLKALGSVSERVAHGAACSTLIVR
jgi:nucleotide-binding universal stress UspA family protein